MPVFFSRSEVDVDIIHAFLALEKGLLLDRLGITSLVGRTDLCGYHV